MILIKYWFLIFSASTELPSKNSMSPSHTKELFVSPGCTLAQMTIMFFLSSFLEVSSVGFEGLVMVTISVKLPAHVLAKLRTLIMEEEHVFCFSCR